jgi:serine/threonine protein kinase
VHEAEVKGMGQNVAVKIPNPGIGMDYLRREARTLFDIEDHPSIVRLLGVVQQFDEQTGPGPLLALVFELCEEASLHTHLRTQNISDGEWLRMAEQVRISLPDCSLWPVCSIAI